MKKTVLELYSEYITKRGSCLSVFQAVASEYNIRTGLYPGSYIHITPSLVIPEMYYVDNNHKAKRFFHNKQWIKSYIEKNKAYKEDAIVDFEGADYTKTLKLKTYNYDLLISLYSGFISQYCKAFLKKDGILLVNDSHGDATLAFYDKTYEFIGFIGDSESGDIKYDDLHRFFKMKSGKSIDINAVMRTMKGPNYYEKVEYYLFRKIL